MDKNENFAFIKLYFCKDFNAVVYYLDCRELRMNLCAVLTLELFYLLMLLEEVIDNQSSVKKSSGFDFPNFLCYPEK